MHFALALAPELTRVSLRSIVVILRSIVVTMAYAHAELVERLLEESRYQR